MQPSQSALGVEYLRSLFPVFAHTSTVFLDNAGGSQLPGCVIDAMTRYLTCSYANTGGTYRESVEAAATIKGAHDLVRTFVNGDGLGEVILGSSTTALVHLVANAHADAMDAARAVGGPGETLRRNRIIVASAGHEANIGPWMRLAARGFDVVLWPTQRDADGQWRPLLSTLRTLLDERTLLVAFPQVSNILGEVWDAKAVCDAAHSVGAKAMIDGVAYAPHHAPDVRAMGADWYAYSPYKVFGPHMGALFATHAAIEPLTGPNHFFIPKAELPRKWEVGGVSHEACAGLLALGTFAKQVLGLPSDAMVTRQVVDGALAAMVQLERGVQAQLLEGLQKSRDIRIVGPSAGSRVATVSFVHARESSGDFARRANAAGVGVRFGHFYSKRLLEELSIDTREGVIRASLVGYTTVADITKLLSLLQS
jgi:selenocysteine lyase/cysteine desulfurase